mmetsp:Transcript_28327/g.49839  ORF Transcript_28327/g.49839 Transcript_28327/m.49839 type:complete len:224 (+) Transcript_28327:276-947(+)
MSSILSNMQVDSIAVLTVCIFTEIGSQTLMSDISTISPVLPSTPQLEDLPSACFARSSVITRITLLPQFSIRVLGITSKAAASPSKGLCWIFWMIFAFWMRALPIAISDAPPPGTILGSVTSCLATCIASCRFLSISLRTSLPAPRRSTVQALGFLHSSKKVKYSSPIFLTSKRPQFLPTCSSLRSAGSLMTVAPTARAILLLSVFRRRRRTEIPALIRKCWA